MTDRPIDAVDNLVMDEAGHLKYHYVLLQFLARPKSGTLKASSDVSEAQWVPLEKVENYELTKTFPSF